MLVYMIFCFKYLNFKRGHIILENIFSSFVEYKYKEIVNMGKNRLFLVLFCMANFMLNAQEQLDQVSEDVNSGFFTFDHGGGAQSFTAGISGTLSKVELKLRIGADCKPSTYGFNIQILQGSGRTGAVLANQEVTVDIPLNTQFVPIIFSNPTILEAYKQYTIQWVNAYSSGCYGIGLIGHTMLDALIYVGRDPYFGGSIYEGRSLSPTNYYDAIFKTYVDPTLGNDTVFTTPINVGHVQGSNDYEIIFSEKQAVATVNVLDTLGRLVTSKSVKNSSELNFEINGNSGVYFIQLTNELNQVMSIKVVK